MGALVLLAQLLEDDVGVITDKVSAIQNLSKAAANGQINATREMALSYVNGDGYTEDSEKRKVNSLLYVTWLHVTRKLAWLPFIIGAALQRRTMLLRRKSCG